MDGGGRRLCLTGRSELSVEGVTEVISFDSDGAELLTEDGRLFVCGEGIRISSLETESGRILLGGRIDSMEYESETPAPKRGLFSRSRG